jgi:hypothetical protein
LEKIKIFILKVLTFNIKYGNMLSRKEVRWIMAKKKRAVKEITFEVSLIPLKLYIKVVFK